MAKSHRKNIPGRVFVLDNGSYSMKAGFAQTGQIEDDEALKSCETIPNCVVRTRDRKTYIASQMNDVTQWGEAIFRRPAEAGQIVSWETQREIWEHSIFDVKTASQKAYIDSPADTTLILTEASNALPSLQKNMDEMIMEEWGFGAYTRATASSLNAYNALHPLFEGVEQRSAHIHPTDPPMECLLVIDSGFSGTTISPCYQGRPIQRAIRRLDIGGKHLTNLLMETVSVRHFDLHQETKIVNDIKEDVSFVSRNFKADMESTWPRNAKLHKGNNQAEQDVDLRQDYVLPDGVNLVRGYARPHDPSRAAAKKRKQATMHSDSNEVIMTLGNERFTIPEVIFNPSDIGSKQPGIADCVVQSLSKLPPLLQATMIANTIVLGGNACIPGFVERLQDELRTRIRIEWPVRVRAMAEPVQSTWLGGARLAAHHGESLARLTVTREQYLEHGSGWAARHFAAVG